MHICLRWENVHYVIWERENQNTAFTIFWLESTDYATYPAVCRHINRWWIGHRKSICLFEFSLTTLHITETCLYTFDPLKPHFYIVKLGFTGVYIIFLISAKKYRLWVLVRTASSRRFTRVPTIYVLSKIMKNIRFFIWKLPVFGSQIISIFKLACFRNGKLEKG